MGCLQYRFLFCMNSLGTHHHTLCMLHGTLITLRGDMILHRTAPHRTAPHRPHSTNHLIHLQASREKIFAKAASRVYPFLFIDDEFVGTFSTIAQLEAAGRLEAMFDY